MVGESTFLRSVPLGNLLRNVKLMQGDSRATILKKIEKWREGTHSETKKTKSKHNINRT